MVLNLAHRLTFVLEEPLSTFAELNGSVNARVWRIKLVGQGSPSLLVQFELTVLELWTKVGTFLDQTTLNIQVSMMPLLHGFMEFISR